MLTPQNHSVRTANVTHLLSSDLVKFIRCCVQIDPGKFAHLTGRERGAVRILTCRSSRLISTGTVFTVIYREPCINPNPPAAWLQWSWRLLWCWRNSGGALSPRGPGAWWWTDWCLCSQSSPWSVRCTVAEKADKFTYQQCFVHAWLTWENFRVLFECDAHFCHI